MIDQTEASRLIGFGFQPRRLPTQDGEYAELCLRFRSDGEFAIAVRAIADGLEVDVLDVSSKSGILLAPRSGSPFAQRLEDYVSRGNASERLIHGIIHLALAAACFPRAADLEPSDRVVRVSAREADRLVRDLCELLARGDDSDDPPVDMPELEPAYRAYTKRASTAETPDERGHQSTTIRMCERALQWLERQGLATKGPLSEKQGQIYIFGSRYRTLVRDAAGRSLLDDLRDLYARGRLKPPGELESS